MRKVAERNRRRALAGLASVALAVAGLMVLQPPPAQAAPTDILTLKVTSARTEPRAFGGTGVSSGRRGDTCKFIINRDTTGSTAQAPPPVPARPAPRLPQGLRLDLDQRRRRRRADRRPGRPGRPRRRPRPPRRQVPHLRARRRLQARRRALHHAARPTTPRCRCSSSRCRCPTPRSRARCSRTWHPPTVPTTPATSPSQGFVGHLNDVLGEVSTDVYGNPLCTTYVGEDPVTHEIPLSALDADMAPVVRHHRRPVRQRRRRRRDLPAHGHEPLHAVRHAAARATRRTGSRPPRSRATTTGTPG